VTADDNVFISDTYSNRLRKVYANGTITTIAGNGQPSFAGDDGLATSASLYYPTGVAVAADGNVFIGDLFNHRIRKVYTNGTITTVTWIGGDGGSATSVSLSYPNGVAVAADGNVFIADTNNHRILKLVM